jgi:hypothetical protein
MNLSHCRSRDGHVTCVIATFWVQSTYLAAREPFVALLGKHEGSNAPSGVRRFNSQKGSKGLWGGNLDRDLIREAALDRAGINCGHHIKVRQST